MAQTCIFVRTGRHLEIGFKMNYATWYILRYSLANMTTRLLSWNNSAYTDYLAPIIINTKLFDKLLDSNNIQIIRTTVFVNFFIIHRYFLFLFLKISFIYQNYIYC